MDYAIKNSQSWAVYTILYMAFIIRGVINIVKACVVSCQGHLVPAKSEPQISTYRCRSELRFATFKSKWIKDRKLNSPGYHALINFFP